MRMQRSRAACKRGARPRRSRAVMRGARARRAVVRRAGCGARASDAAAVASAHCGSARRAGAALGRIPHRMARDRSATRARARGAFLRRALPLRAAGEADASPARHASPCAPRAAPQAGEETLKLLNKIRSLAKSATELSSRGVNDAAEYLHVKLWDGAPHAHSAQRSATRQRAHGGMHARARGRARAVARRALIPRRDAAVAPAMRARRQRADASRRTAWRRAEIRGMSLADIMPLIRAVRPSRGGGCAARATARGVTPALFFPSVRALTRPARLAVRALLELDRHRGDAPHDPHQQAAPDVEHVS